MQQLSHNTGQADVWLARDLRARGRQVAIKIYRQTEDGRRDRRFEAEVAALSILGGHDNIVDLYQVIETAGRGVLVLEYADRGSLEGLLLSGELSAIDALRLVVVIARTLHSAIEQDFIHRDIKPANILVKSQDGGIKPLLADFGIGLFPDATKTSNQPGTLGFQAPELARSAQAVGNAATEVYSLGATAAWIVEHGVDVNGEVSRPTVQELTRRAMDPHPEDRFASCDAFAEALDLALPTTQPIAATRLTSGLSVADSEMTTSGTGSGRSQQVAAQAAGSWESSWVTPVFTLGGALSGVVAVFLLDAGWSLAPAFALAGSAATTVISFFVTRRSKSK